MSDKPSGIPGTSPRDEDDEVDLGISLRAVANIIDTARAADESDEDDEEGDLTAEDAADADSSDETLETLIDELNEDEQAALIALAWVGHGDYEPDEWEEALNLARERNETDPAGYLMGMEMLGDLLAEGLAAFGIVVEEIER
ncbi:DUF3775 domain-containing protein [Roseomonas sp. SSH11]|uniref:DUF3775 domain-containing protein n=1 Tax=Pararoseomonas baculiformis TaxID=2820812 RepID=A0ABS4A9G5_9PROT|nr:DUF3775 domain-containing protein [Pararoseomonas baculiformis]MBP0443168.1 DUF3775 domain-containing protein [Pararoseomonas baculiformis]